MGKRIEQQHISKFEPSFEWHLIVLRVDYQQMLEFKKRQTHSQNLGVLLQSIQSDKRVHQTRRSRQATHTIWQIRLLLV